MLFVISYDIPDDKRRLKLAKILGSYGERVQYSVFEAHLDDRDFRRLRAKISKLIEPAEDSVRYYNLGDEYQQRILIDGQGIVKAELEYIIL
jgi:CRISPR-associated protein Cas2